jgi:pyruvate dehydrogenase E1 component
MYRLRESPLGGAAAKAGAAKKIPRVQLLGSGTILREALAAAEILEQEYDIAADVWSVTSFTELRRDGLECERWNREHADDLRKSWVEQCLANAGGPIIAASDYVRAVVDLIRGWVPGKYVALGTDGFGRSDTRAALRSYFGVDAQSIAKAAAGAAACART